MLHSFSSGQPVQTKPKEGDDVGVVSNVAIYSLKAKVGKLEIETKKLNEKVQQLEKEKSTLSLLNTEARYYNLFVCLELFSKTESSAPIKSIF